MAGNLGQMTRGSTWLAWTWPVKYLAASDAHHDVAAGPIRAAAVLIDLLSGALAVEDLRADGWPLRALNSRRSGTAPLPALADEHQSLQPGLPYSPAFFISPAP